GGGQLPHEGADGEHEHRGQQPVAQDQAGERGLAEAARSLRAVRALAAAGHRGGTALRLGRGLRRGELVDVGADASSAAIAASPRWLRQATSSRGPMVTTARATLSAEE